LPKIAGPGNRAGQSLRIEHLKTKAVAAGISVALFAAPCAYGGSPPDQSLFDQLFPSAHASATVVGAPIELPYPFSQLLDELRRRTSNAEVVAGLYPFGRSLHRHAATPNYFASPRMVLGVVGDGRNEQSFADRLYMGYQPAANSIEIISFNEARGRFEFQEVTGFSADAGARINSPNRQICTNCHQGEGPIFSVSPWNESNANPGIAANIAAQAGLEFQGIAVRSNFDGIGRLSQSVGKANLLIAAAEIWREGCGKGEEGRICRAQLLADALCLRLAGNTCPDKESHDTAPSIATLGARRWPHGLMLTQFEIPDRDVLALLVSPDVELDRLEPEGIFDPESPRPGLVVWRATSDRQESKTQAAQLVAELIPARFLNGIDAQLADLDFPPEVFALGCKFWTEGDDNIFICGGDGIERADGFLKMEGNRVSDGRFTRLELGIGGSLRRVEVSGSKTEQAGDGLMYSLDLRQDLNGLKARLANGPRISVKLTKAASNGNWRMDIFMVDDLAPMRQALLKLAEARDESTASLFDGNLLPAAAISSILPLMPDVMHLGGG